MKNKLANKTIPANFVTISLLFVIVFAGTFFTIWAFFPRLHIGIAIGIAAAVMLALLLWAYLKLWRGASAEVKALKILTKDNNPGGYIDEMHRILEANPHKAQDYNFNMNLATGYFKNGDTQKAMEMWKDIEENAEAMKHGNVRAVLYSNICMGYLAQDNLELAKVYYDKCAKEDKYAKRIIPYLDENFNNAKALI